jgi:hypothetical protein
MIIASAIIAMGSLSFAVNNGLNFTLSMFVWVFLGLDDPFSCRRIRWIRAIAAIRIGRMKCREKNRFRVGWETEGPPQIHVTSSFPTIGMADRTPVITVAPQKDICPHGRTYPRNAVAITISIISTPEIHTFGLFDGDKKYIPRAVWMYIRIKNRDAPFMWIIRVIHPVLMSRVIMTMILNTDSVWGEYTIDKNSPVMICRTRVIARRNPMFHINEIDEGVGRSIRDLFTMFSIGLIFLSCFFIC